jgi:hypothetical protein
LKIPLAFLLLFSMTIAGQQSAPIQPPSAPGPPLPGAHGKDEPPWTRDQMEKMRKERTAAREKQIKEDTAKLLQLATFLKESVDKTNQNVLSLDVVKKAEEIEKLAKRIKNNMRDETR